MDGGMLSIVRDSSVTNPRIYEFFVTRELGRAIDAACATAGLS